MNKKYSVVSIVIIAICLAIAGLSKLGASDAALAPFFIASPGVSNLREIWNGQVWRLITPIFIHFGLMHLVFNLMWVWDLGRLIEEKRGAAFYIIFLLVVGCASNLAQYQMTHSQFFGGMSGVLYGMFGYIWIRGRYDAHFSEDLQKNTIVMMLAWFVLCWTGLLGHIANWAHTAGLVAGIAWAYLDRLLPGKNPAQNHVLPDKQSLQYLSTADMLKLEQQRQWVRDHCASATRNQDDSVEATLRNIDQIVLLHHDKPLSKEDVHALDISFGDALAMATGASWATLEDRNGRTPVLYMPGATPVVFPVNSVALWLPHQSQKTIHQLFHEVAELMRSHWAQQVQ